MRASYRHPPKPIDRPEHISVLIPTRGRPAGLAKVFENFHETVEHKDLLDVWLYVDDDDRLTLDYIASGAWKAYGLAVNWHVAKSAGSMGEMFNRLWQNCSTNPGLYFPFPDDYAVATQHWDSLLHRAFSRYEDGIMLGFLPDNTARPHQVTFAVPSSRWLNLLGYFLTNRFHFWFDDQWLDEIAAMAGRKVMIPILLENPVGRGRTPRMRRLPFWARYFNLTLEDRYQDALTILREMHAGDARAIGEAREQALSVAGHLVNAANAHSDEVYAQMEKVYGDAPTGTTPAKLAAYLATELSAIDDLLGKLAHSCRSGDHLTSLDLGDALKLASFRALEVDEISAAALDALGARAGKVLHSELRLPSWLDMAEPRDILFPARIAQELFYAIQRLLYQEEITTIIDIGAGDGAGSTRAVVDTLDGRERVVFCIEPDATKCERIRQRYAGRVRVHQGSSVRLKQYMSESELVSFYIKTPSILNYYPLDVVTAWYRDELAGLVAQGERESKVEEVRRLSGIENFDMAILDGSLFSGTADLDAAYGARYLALNHVRSVKNYSNMLRLLADASYEAIELNYRTGCGHAVFRRRSGE